MRIELTLAPPRSRAVIAAVDRLHEVSIAEGDAAEALATDDQEAAERAAAQGRHVLFFAADPGAVDAVSGACRRAGVRFMPAHYWRFRPSAQAVAKSREAGELGAPGLVRVHRWSPDAVEEIDATAILPEMDLTLWAFGSPVESLFAVRRRNKFLQAHFGFVGGGMALVDYAFGFPGRYESFCLIGATGAAYADDHHNMNLLYGAAGPSALLAGQGDLDIRTMLEEFRGSIWEERPPAVTAADSRRALEAALAVLEVAQEVGRAS